MLDERFVTNPETTIERIASVIVHEATHARMERCGIGYAEDQRARIETVCFRRELAFAVRLEVTAEHHRISGLVSRASRALSE